MVGRSQPRRRASPTRSPGTKDLLGNAMTARSRTCARRSSSSRASTTRLRFLNAVRRRHLPGSRERQGVRRRRDGESRRRVARLLADHRPLRRAVREARSRRSWVCATPCCATRARRRTCSQFTALTSPRLGKRRLEEGDEVITVAAGFPTTVNPIYQNRLTPVFVDAELGTYDVDIDRLAEAVGPKTRAIVMAHTLGNPFDLGAVMEIAARARPLGRRRHLRRGRCDLRRQARRIVRSRRQRQASIPRTTSPWVRAAAC